MAFDPNPAPGPPPMISRKQVPRQQDPSPPAQSERPPRDYFSGGRLSSKQAAKEGLKEEVREPSSRSVSTERETERLSAQSKASPHILYQEKGRNRKRETSENNTPASVPDAASPSMATSQDSKQERSKPQNLETSSYTLTQNESFKLQEAPKARKSRSGTKTDNKSPVLLSPIEPSSKHGDGNKTVSDSPVSLDSPGSINPFDDPKRKEHAAPTGVAPPSKPTDRPARGDSLNASALKHKDAAPDLTPTTTTPATVSTQLAPSHDRAGSASSVPSSFADAQSTLSRGDSRSKPTGSPSYRTSIDQLPPPRASSRPSAPSKSVGNGDFITPRAPPPPPPGERHKKNESISTMESSEVRPEKPYSPGLGSAGLPKHSIDGSFSMDLEMQRILRGEKPDQQQGSGSSVLRRVSNAVKHGRSFSDRAANAMDKSHSPPSRSIEISSPMGVGNSTISSPTTSADPLEQLRQQNRRQAQQIAEQQAEIDALRDQVNNSAYIKAATSELKEKRNTISMLDTQREMIINELESMTTHLKKAKDNNQPLDYNQLKSDILRDFGESMQRLKDRLSGDIEGLMRQRSELTDEIGTLIQMKDKGFQEFESLQGRNTQLIEMNNQLVQNIQVAYKANRVPNGAAATNGLGIYHPGAKEITSSSDVRNLNLVNTDSSMPNLLQETDAEPVTVLTAPQVVNIRKGQPKKFNWRKGGEKMAKNITKGVKGAFAGESIRMKESGMPYGEIGVPYSQTQQQAAPGSEQSSLSSKQNLDGRGGTSFGFFGQKNGGLKAGAGTNMRNNSSNTNLTAGNDPSGKLSNKRRTHNVFTDGIAVLFGSELEARCEFEKRVIPSIVSRCVEEVEARGMDVEGIYRKSGGTNQVKTVQAGFEQDGHYDISDPDLDIHAVTSALKQYFRKLPIPLITYDVYETFLEAGQTSEKEKQAYKLRLAIADLPEHHRNCLEYLVLHLARVTAREGENLMTPLNLSVVFAPTIMRPESIEREMSDMSAQRIAVQALLDQHKTVFADED